MIYINQYLRDIFTLLSSKILKNKIYMYFFYNYLCFKNVFWKITWIKFKSQKFKNYKFKFDNYNAFFAIFTEIFIYNLYFFESDKKNPFIVDFWWNIGVSIVYFKYLFPNCTIECYEPDKETFKILEDNVKINNFSNVKCINKAVSWKSWELEFYSFWNMEWWPWNTLEKSQVNFSNVNSYKVKVVALSELWYEHIDYLKMDIEWSEWNVFSDLEKSGFIDKVDRIVLEYHYDEWLENNKLSKILDLLERNNMHAIINNNALVWFYTSVTDFLRRNCKYVLMINAYKNWFK